MTETGRQQLHLGKCIEDLDKLHNIHDLKSKTATALCKTAQKLFESAAEAQEKGDEEYSYVCYMKYLRVVARISKDKDYKRDKTYFNQMLGPKNPNKAIDASEELKNSLIDRYNQEQQKKRLDDIQKNKVIKQKIDENRKKASEAAPAPEPSQPLGVPGRSNQQRTATETATAPVNTDSDCSSSDEERRRAKDSTATKKHSKKAKPISLGSCPICMDDYSNGQALASTTCGHVFCRGCLITALDVESKCPTCRALLTGGPKYHAIYL